MFSLLRVLVVLFLLGAGAAHAVIPTVYNYRASFASNTAMRASPDAACADALAWRSLYPGGGAPGAGWVATLVSVTTRSATAGDCVISMKRTSDGLVQGPPTYNVGWIGIAGYCPANSTLGGGSCSCNSGYAENATKTACDLNQAQCTPGQSVSGGYFDAGSEVAKGPPYIACKDGCASAFDGEYPAGSALVGGKKHYFAKGMYSQTGSKCDSGGGVGVPTGAGNTPVASEGVPADTCAAGESKGVVNGKSVCAPDMSQPGQGTQPSTNPEPPKSDDKKTSDSTSETTTNADGSKTTTTTTTTKNVDGTSTTTKTTSTTNADGTPRSSSTTTTGSGVTKEAEDQAKAKCEKNAADAGCGGDPTAVNGAGLYTKKDKTVRAVLVGAKDSLNASPAGAAMSNFFSVGGGGSCPTSAGSFTLFNRTMAFSFDGFCSSSALSMFFVIKGVLLLIASVWAFRVAVE